MADRETIEKGLHDIAGFIAGRIGFEQARNFLRTTDETVVLLKEQEDKIRQLRLALQILNGNGIKVDTEGR